MDNNGSINFFKELIKNNPEKGIEKYGHDNSDIDASFILQHLNSHDRILDIGSGSGLIINKIEGYVRHITAVEPLLEFSGYIKKSEKIDIVNQSVFDFDPQHTYDLVTLFGFMHYLNKDEAKIVYKKCYRWLNPCGKVIVKNQFGICEDVIVDGYSKELGMDYHANYRQINKEAKLLEDMGFKDIQFADIYPPDRNRWPNTHFYAIIASR